MLNYPLSTLFVLPFHGTMNTADDDKSCGVHSHTKVTESKRGLPTDRWAVLEMETKHGACLLFFQEY